MGEKITGGTVYWLDDGVDTGDIAAQDWCWILPADTAATLWRRELAPMGLRLFEVVLLRLTAGEVPRRPQPKENATWEPAWKGGRLGP